jgi:hypothetical protein
MLTAAICAASLEESVRRAAGVEPILSPPACLGTWNPTWVRGREFVYVKLHGMRNSPYWYGDSWLVALSAGEIRKLDLAGSTWFVASCHLDESPMLGALLAAGAVVVGGSGPNYGGKTTLLGADLLGYWLRRSMSWGVRPEPALRIARARMALDRSKASQDAALFRIWRPEET